MSDKIYFDNAATTRVRPEVLQAMQKFFDTSYGNASGVYELARESKKALEEARGKVAKAIGAAPEEIFFTGSGTEADNWAIKGICESNADKGKHIITTQIEHHAVLHTCQYMEKHGYEVTYLPVDEQGLVSLELLEKSIRKDTVLISIMFANNEIGTIQPIKEIGCIAKKHNVIFHTDAVQAVGSVPIDVKDMGINLLSLSGHKLYAPKGVGALYIQKGTRISPFIHGGAQEKNKRAGTENIPYIVGLGCAMELLNMEMEASSNRIIKLRNKLIDGILETIPHTFLNGSRDKRLPGNVNISFEFIEGESLLLLLDMIGIYASSGSACTSGSLDASHVLLAIGVPHEKAHGSLRVTIGKYNTEEEVDIFLAKLPALVNRLREMSPLYNEK